MRIRTPELVGRDKDLQKLKDALAKAVKGEGQSVFVSGEAGLGKTRLVTDLLGQALKEGVKCLSSKCLFLEGSDPYLPFTDALRGQLQDTRADDGKDETSAKDEGFSGMLPMGLMGIGPEKDEDLGRAGLATNIRTTDDRKRRSRGGETGTDFTKERERMFSAITSILSDITAEQPVALFLDDLHWADTATLQLLSYVIRNSLDQRLMIIGAYRTTDVDAKRGHPLKEVLQRARRERRNTEVKLGHLKKDDIGRMIGSMLEVGNVPDIFTERIFKEAGGNPFFVEEVIKSLVQEGAVSDSQANLEEVDIDRIKVPRSVTDLINRKFEGLDETQKKILDYSAIIGESFSLDVLGKVIDMDEMGLVDQLERLMELKLIDEYTEKSDIRYRFSHKQFREVIYDNLSSARKRLFHKKVGHVLEGLPERVRDSMLFSLAHHLTMAMEIDKAINYTMKAAERAEVGYAAEDAISYYEKVLELLDRLPPGKEVAVSKKDMVSKIAELKFLTKSWKDAMRYLRTLEKVAMGQNDDPTLAEVYMKIGHIERMRGDWTRASEAYDKALALSEKVQDELGIAETLQGLGHIMAVKGEYEVAKAYLEKSIDISKASDDVLSLGRTHLEMGHLYRDQGLFDEALAIYTDGLLLLDKAGDQFSMTRGYMALGDLCMRTEEWEKAVDFFKKAQGMAGKSRDNQMMSWTLFRLGECFAHMGSFEKAEELAGKALMTLLKSDDKVGLTYAYTSYGVVFRLKGDQGKAFVQFQQALNTANDLDMPAVTANINLEMGLMYLDKGDTLGANRFFEKARKLYEKAEAKALAEQAARLLTGDERYSQSKDAKHFLDKSMKAMQKRTERRSKDKEKGKGRNRR